MIASEQFRAALAVEWTKFRHAPVAIVASVALVIGVAALSMTTLIPPSAGGGALSEKIAAFSGTGGWEGLFGAAAQVVSIGGLLAYGVVAGWVYGREFTDGTIVGLYGLPVSRASIAGAKLVILLAWAVATAVGLTVVVLVVGWAADLRPPATPVAALAGQLFLVSGLTAVLSLVCGLVATLTRGYLAAVGAVVGLVVLAQIAVLTGVGGWFPYAAPGIWAASGTPSVDLPTIVQLCLVVPVSAFAAWATLRAWRRLTL